MFLRVHAAQANKVDGNEALPWLARGHLALARNNVDEAAKSFHAASERRDNGADTVASTLGAACCAFHRGAYSEALRLYGRAMRRHPHAPPAAHLGLGATLLRLGHASRARAAFERALALDAGSAEAQLGVALCAAAPQQADVATALARLHDAYDLNPMLSPVLLMLSEHAGLTSQSAVADALAHAASDTAEATQLRGAASLQLGRLAHTGGRAAEAAKHYNAALSFSPTDMTPHLGLGQVALARDELHSATAHLERVAATPAGTVCTQRALGHVYASSHDAGRRQRAVELLNAAAQADPCDAGIFAELAELLRHDAPPSALTAYENALNARRACGQPPSAALHNNAGVLAAAVASDATGIRAARAHYAAALDACDAGWVAALSSQPAENGSAGIKRVLAGQASVIAFNLACLEHDCRNMQLADALFAQLRRDCPGEVDVLLHHACSSMARGALAAAEELASEAHATAPRNPNAVAMLGGLAVARRDFKSAQALLDSFRKGTGSADARAGAHAYAYDEHIMICAANALLADSHRDSNTRAVRGDPSAETEAASRRANRLERALALYSKALVRAPNNAYAANGVGAVLAERGRLDEAAAVFMSVAEAAVGDNALSTLAHDALLNYAHCQLGLGAQGRAVRLYDQVLRKRGRDATDARVLLCKARALHDWKADGESHLPRARTALLHALHLMPGDHRARFDVAFVSQEQAVRLLARFREQSVGSDSRLALADAACDELHLAGRFFRQLLALGESHANGSFDAKRTHIHAAFCADALAKATAARAQAARENEAAQARRAAQELERAAEEERQRQIAEARRAADAENLRRREEQAAVAREKLEAARQRWATPAEAEDADKRRGGVSTGNGKQATEERAKGVDDGAVLATDEADADVEALQAAELSADEPSAGHAGPLVDPEGGAEAGAARVSRRLVRGAADGDEGTLPGRKRLRDTLEGDSGVAPPASTALSLEEDDDPHDAEGGTPRRMRRVLLDD